MHYRSRNKSSRKKRSRGPLSKSSRKSLKQSKHKRSRRSRYKSKRKLTSRSERIKLSTRVNVPKKKPLKKTIQISFSGPLDGNKVYCGTLEHLPTNEYSRFGSRHECLVKGLRTGYGSGRKAEYSYLRKLLLREGYQIPDKPAIYDEE